MEEFDRAITAGGLTSNRSGRRDGGDGGGRRSVIGEKIPGEREIGGDGRGSASVFEAIECQSDAPSDGGMPFPGLSAVESKHGMPPEMDEFGESNEQV